MALYFVFLVTFIVFPGTFMDSYFDMLNSIDDKDKRASWYSILIILLFNVFDTIGRFSGGKFHLGGTTIMGASYTRSVFVATTTLIAF